MEFRQLNDPRIKKISDLLKSKDNGKFALINDLVYRKDGDNRTFVLPDSMVNSILRAYHNNMAHYHGFEKTVQGINQHYWFPSMCKRIADYLENCFTCIMSNSSLDRLEDESHIYPSTNNPMEIIHINHFGPL